MAAQVGETLALFRAELLVLAEVFALIELLALALGLAALLLALRLTLLW